MAELAFSALPGCAFSSHFCTLLVFMATTPPLPQGPPQIPDTPIHLRNTTTNRFDPKFEDRGNAFIRLANEMCPYFVGPVPITTFLDSFLPLLNGNPNFAGTTSSKNVFSALKNTTSEADMYQPFVRPHAIPYFCETDFFFSDRCCFPIPPKPMSGQYIPLE